MRSCSRCDREPHQGALLCKVHIREALRSIRRAAAEREEMLMEREPE